MTRKLAVWLTVAILVLVPFHAFLTVFGSSIVGHYTLLRLWDDVLLAVLFGVACWWLVRDRDLREWFFGSLLVRLILIYSVLTLVLGVVALVRDEVTLKAAGYGVLVNLRFLAWFLIVFLAAQCSSFLRRAWPRLLLIPALIVVVFATLQYTVLPHDFLSHFGYDAQTTIAPIETINHNAHYIRVQSFLRGANPLGAYLVLVLAALGTLFLRGNKRIIIAVSGVLALCALYASGSRSAWIGAVLSLATVVLLSLKTRRGHLIFAGVCLLVALVGASAFVTLHTNTRLQNELFHTQDNAASQSSNDAHLQGITSGLKDVVRQPLGDGPGTSGPASVYNAGHNSRINDNYYIQIAQETGWLGLVLFMSIVILVGIELYTRITNSRLALVLFASLVGLLFVGLLSHAWTDDTLAFIWWGLAGIALAKPRKVA